MPNLIDFYNATRTLGFAKDYQLRLTALKIKGTDLLTQNTNLSQYIKKLTLPDTEDLAVLKQQFADSQIVLPSGAIDYPNKDNYPITFWLDQKHSLYNALRGCIPIEDEVDIAKGVEDGVDVADASTSIMTIEAFDDQGISVVKYNFEGVTVRKVNSVDFSVEGTGKPQEFTAVFTFTTFNRDANSEAQIRVKQTYTEDEKELISRPRGSGDGNRLISKSVMQYPSNVPQGGGLLQTLNQITQGARGVAAAAAAIRGTGRAIRGR